jgi:tRNA-specific 2-thiouridylase
MAAANGERIVVGMSGGVDSAVAALRLIEAGHDVHGLYMSNWDDEDIHCSNAQDYQDARSAARELGIVLHRVSFEPEYRQRVFAEFLDEYRRGRTPNPDVLCNREIKFGVCLHYAQRLGAAGSPRATMRGSGGRGRSDAAARRRCRQGSVLFPVRRGARSLRSGAVSNWRTRTSPRCARARSAPACRCSTSPTAPASASSASDRSRNSWPAYLPEQPGPIETADGRRLGTHRGLHFYTLGQRGGLEIGGVRGGSGDPWYVAHKHTERNALIVVAARERDTVTTAALRTGAINWLDGSARRTVHGRRENPLPAAGPAGAGHATGRWPRSPSARRAC